MAYFDAVFFLASAAGTGDFGVASAIQGYRTPAAASVPNAAVGGYRAESSDLSQWEIGVFTYSTTGPTVARTTVLANSSGNTSKINFITAPNVGFVELSQDLTNASLLLTGTVPTNVLGSGTANANTALMGDNSWKTLRQVLAANRIYYVRTDGNDGNDGLTNNSGGAFLTIQNAWNTITKLDLGGFSATIKLGNSGTFTGNLLADIGPVGGQVIIEGDTTTPANTIINTTSVDAIRIQCAADVTLQSFELRTTTGGSCVRVSAPGVIRVGSGMRFGPCAARHLYAISGGYILANGPTYTISGNAQSHWNASLGGIIEVASANITLSGTPAFSNQFAYAGSLSAVSAFSSSFTGTATGVRYYVALNSVINTYGAGATSLPGNGAGSAVTGGQYA